MGGGGMRSYPSLTAEEKSFESLYDLTFQELLLLLNDRDEVFRCMNTVFSVISLDDTISNAMKKLSYRQLASLPLVEPGGKFLGSVNKANLVKACKHKKSKKDNRII